METADPAQSDVAEAKTSRISDKISKLKQQMQELEEMEQQLRESPDGQVSMTDPDACSNGYQWSGSPDFAAPIRLVPRQYSTGWAAQPAWHKQTGKQDYPASAGPMREVLYAASGQADRSIG